MAKISSNQITSLSQDWGKDETNGLPYSGQAVQNFLKGQISSIKTTLDGKFGGVTYEGGKINFYDESGGSLLESLTITGTSYIVSVESNRTSNFTVLTSDTSTIVTLKPSTYSMEFGSSVKEEYPEDYTFKVEVDNGSGFVDKTPANNAIKNGETASVEVRNNLTIGTNRIRIVVTGTESGQPRTMVFTALVTSLSLTVNHRWQKVWYEGEAYAINGILFGGNIAKTLHVKVNGTDVEPISYSASTQHTTVPTTFDLSNYEPTSSGVTSLEIWMTGDGVETTHYYYNVIHVKTADKGNVSFICINEVPAKVFNYKQTSLLKYSVYGISTITATINAVIDGEENLISEQTTDVSVETIYNVEPKLEIDTEKSTGVSVKVTLASGVVSEERNIPVDNSTAYLPVDGAMFILKPSLGNNASADRTTIINSAELDNKALDNYLTAYEGTWTGFTFADDAWAKDSDGNNALVVKAGSSLTLPDLKPLRMSADAGTSQTIEFMFRASNIADYDTPILTCMDTEEATSASTGLIVYPTKVVLYAKSERNEIYQKLPLTEDRIHHIAVVIQKGYGDTSYNLAHIYINGCLNVSFDFDGTDTFFNATGDNTLRIGQTSTDTYLYMMRIYDKALEQTGVFQNYLNALIETAEVSRDGLKDDNNILDGNAISYDMAKQAGFNIYVVETDKPIPSLDHQDGYEQVETAEGSGEYTTGVNVRYEYAEHPEWNVTIKEVPMDRQGTTAKKYYMANLRHNIKQPVTWIYPNIIDPATGQPKQEKSKRGYLFGYGNDAAVSKITNKKNIASQPQGHKMGATSLYNDLFKKVMGGSEKLVSDKILPTEQARVATKQMPFLGFQMTSDGIYKFIGLYTGGPDKTDKKTFGYDATKNFPSLMMIEGPNHSPFLTRFLVPWTDDVFYDYPNETLSIGAPSAADGDKEEGWDADIVADYDTDKENDATNVLSLYESEFKPAYDAIYYCSPYIASIAETGYESVEAINADIKVFQSEYTNGHQNELLTLYNETYELVYYQVKTKQYEVLSKSAHDMLTYLELSGTPTTAQIIEARRQKWLTLVPQYVNMSEAYFRTDFDELIGASDNDAKNSYWRKFLAIADGGKWGFNEDDLDTIFQNDNNGQDTKEYYIEPNDTNNGDDIFQGRTSAFWYALRLWCADNLKGMMSDIVNSAKTIAQELGIDGTSTHETLFNVINHYFWQQSSKYFPAAAYNADTQIAYTDVWFKDPNATYNSVPPLTQIHGDHYETERDWVEKRIAYIFSKYQIGAFKAGDADGYGSIEFTPASAFTMEVTPSIWLYPRLSQGGSETNATTRTEAGQTCSLPLPVNSTTGVYIKGLDWLSDLGDLSGLKLSSRSAGTSNISFAINGKRLRRVKVGDETNEVLFNANTLAVSGEAIEKIDAQNASTIGGTLNLKGCPRLRTLLLTGTSLTSVLPPKGGRVTKIAYPETLETLFLHSLNLLQSDGMTIPDKTGITGLYINGCDNINALAMLKEIYNLEGNALKNIAAIWTGTIEDDEPATMEMLNEIAKNVSVEGYQGYTYDEAEHKLVATNVPQINGTLKVDYSFYEDVITNISNAGIPLTVLYNPDKLYIRFADPNVLSVLLANMTTDDEVGITKPQAQALTSIGTWFQGNTDITSFEEMQYFGLKNLAQNSFSGCAALTSIVIPASVEYMYSYALMNCTALSSVQILSNQIKTMGNGVFRGCSSLQDFQIPETITSLGNNLFQDSGLTSIIIPDNIITIGNAVFQGCTKLVSIEIPQGITNIGNDAFNNCTALEIEDLSLPNLESAGQMAFYNCKKLKGVTELGNIATVTNGLFNASGVETVVLPETVSTIETSAFYSCANLTSINFPQSITTIGGSAFQSCTKMEVEDLNLPNLTSLGSQAFSGCTNIKKASNLGSVSSIGKQAFSGCSIESVVIPSTTTGLGDYCFAKCSELISITLSDNLTSIPIACFYLCGNITSSVTLSSSVSFIKDSAFLGCNKIPWIKMLSVSVVELTNVNAFYSTSCIFYVPDSLVESYKAADNWTSLASRIKPMSEFATDFPDE